MKRGSLIILIFLVLSITIDSTLVLSQETNPSLRASSILNECTTNARSNTDIIKVTLRKSHTSDIYVYLYDTNVIPEIGNLKLIDITQVSSDNIYKFNYQDKQYTTDQFILKDTCFIDEKGQNTEKGGQPGDVCGYIIGNLNGCQYRLNDNTETSINSQLQQQGLPVLSTQDTQYNTMPDSKGNCPDTTCWNICQTSANAGNVLCPTTQTTPTAPLPSTTSNPIPTPPRSTNPCDNIPLECTSHPLSSLAKIFSFIANFFSFLFRLAITPLIWLGRLIVGNHDFSVDLNFPSTDCATYKECNKMQYHYTCDGRSANDLNPSTSIYENGGIIVRQIDKDGSVISEMPHNDDCAALNNGDIGARKWYCDKTESDNSYDLAKETRYACNSNEVCQDGYCINKECLNPNSQKSREKDASCTRPSNGCTETDNGNDPDHSGITDYHSGQAFSDLTGPSDIVDKDECVKNSGEKQTLKEYYCRDKYSRPEIAEVNCVDEKKVCIQDQAKGDYCGLICGNGKIDPGEECDDGNTDARDGCGPTCKKEVLVKLPDDIYVDKATGNVYFGSFLGKECIGSDDCRKKRADQEIMTRWNSISKDKFRTISIEGLQPFAGSRMEDEFNKKILTRLGYDNKVIYETGTYSGDIEQTPVSNDIVRHHSDDNIIILAGYSDGARKLAFCNDCNEITVALTSGSTKTYDRLGIAALSTNVLFIPVFVINVDATDIKEFNNNYYPEGVVSVGNIIGTGGFSGYELNDQTCNGRIDNKHVNADHLTIPNSNNQEFVSAVTDIYNKIKDGTYLMNYINCLRKTSSVTSGNGGSQQMQVTYYPDLPVAWSIITGSDIVKENPQLAQLMVQDFNNNRVDQQCRYRFVVTGFFNRAAVYNNALSCLNTNEAKSWLSYIKTTLSSATPNNKVINLANAYRWTIKWCMDHPGSCSGQLSFK